MSTRHVLAFTFAATLPAAAAPATADAVSDFCNANIVISLNGSGPDATAFGA